MAPGLEIGDVIIAMGACYHTRLIEQYDLPGTYSAIASYPLLQAAVDKARELSIKIQVGNVISSDIFYPEENYSTLKWLKMGVLSVEMETAAIYALAARHGKQALSILTVSDHIVTGVKASADARQKSFKTMMELALEIA